MKTKDRAIAWLLLVSKFGMRRLQQEAARRLMSLADAARDARNWELAGAQYARVVELIPLDAAAWMQYGHALKEGGAVVEAIEAYRRALLITPHDFDAHLQLGHGLKILGRVDDAIAAYGTVLRLAPSNRDAKAELAALGVDPAFDVIRHFLLRLAPAHSSVEGGSREARTICEVTDLVDYFLVNDRPSGIQRVQIELVRAVQSDSPRKLRFTCFRDQTEDWIEIGEGLLALIVLFLSVGDAALPSDIETVRRFVQAEQVKAQPFRFRAGDALVTLGATWAHPRHLFAVRMLKEQCGLRYLPLLYDLAPLFAAEYCPIDRQEKFKSWLSSALRLADSWICASHSTARELTQAAQNFAMSLPQFYVVPLDGRHSVERMGGLEEDASKLRPFNLFPGQYVVLVSTIEPRKNHVAAFNAWRSLLEKTSLESMPKLVCVGKLGWMFQDVTRWLECHPTISSHIVMISSASDMILDTLYRHCVCSLYPSRYEGWGLPVTESLCHGKIPVCAETTSLPEAGGKFAMYFDPDQELSLEAALERVIFDASFRQDRELTIRACFQPREWRAIAQDFVRIATGRASTAH